MTLMAMEAALVAARSCRQKPAKSQLGTMNVHVLKS